MASRYQYAKKVKDVNNKQVITSLTHVNIEPRDTDIYIITNATDRLDTLSYKYYQSPSFWWVIAMVNNINTGTMAIEPNTRLLIPENLNQILSQLEKQNR